MLQELTNAAVKQLIVSTHATEKISSELARNVSKFSRKKDSETISVTYVKCQNLLLIINCHVDHLPHLPHPKIQLGQISIKVVTVEVENDMT